MFVAWSQKSVSSMSKNSLFVACLLLAAIAILCVNGNCDYFSWIWKWCCLLLHSFTAQIAPPQKCPANEKWACGSACQTTCKTFKEPCPIVNIRCNDACYCIDGFARDEKGICIPDNSGDCENLKPKTTQWLINYYLAQYNLSLILGACISIWCDRNWVE